MEQKKKYPLPFSVGFGLFIFSALFGVAGLRCVIEGALIGVGVMRPYPSGGGPVAEVATGLLIVGLMAVVQYLLNTKVRLV